MMGFRIYILAIVLFFYSMVCAQEIVPLFIGTYTIANKSEGIYVYKFNTHTGESTLLTKINAENPSFLVRNRDATRLYAVNEVNEGSVTAYNFDGMSLKELNSYEFGGAHPCHISMDLRQSFLAVSNYSEGTLNTFLINKDGSIGSSLQELKYTGQGINSERQRAPHIHSAFFTPSGEQLFVQDLGTDRIYIYDIDYSNPVTPKLVLNQTLNTKNGAGPRHITFDEKGEKMYALMELTSQIEVYQQVGEVWKCVQSVDMLDADFDGLNGAAEIRLSPDGRFLYASDRIDANFITAFEINDQGLLSNKRVWDVLGKGPRNFTFTPDGKFLLVANQLSDEVVIFYVNTQDGSIRDSGRRISVCSPTCILF